MPCVWRPPRGDWQWDGWDHLELESCQAVEVCVGLASAPQSSQTVTLQFAVDTVVRDTRTVTLDLLPTPIIGTTTDPGTATVCNIFESSSAAYLELRASEADPANLFVSMTAVDANDTSRVYGSANTRRLLLSSGVWQNISEVDLLVVVKYRLASNSSATCSKTRHCALHIVDVPSGVSGYFVLDGVAPGDVLYSGQSYVAHIFGFSGTNLSYSMWGYCSENPSALFRLSPDSASPEASIVVPPYSDNCTLLLRSQAQDLAGAIAASPGVWYNVSAAASSPAVALRAILDRSIDSLDDVLILLSGLALLPSRDAKALLPAFLDNLTAYTASLASPVDFLRQVSPTLYSHVLYITGATNDYFLPLAQWFTQLATGRALPYAVAQDVGRVVGALMTRITGLATAGGGVIAGATKFAPLATTLPAQDVLADLRAVLSTSVLPALVLVTPQGKVACESGGQTAADRCFAVCTLTDTLAGHLSRGAISVTAVSDPAGKRVVSWRNVNKQWLSSTGSLLPGLTAITSVEVNSICNPAAAVQGFGDPLARFAVLDGATGSAPTLPVAANALRVPILNTTAQSCFQLNVTTGEFNPQLPTNQLNCLTSGFVWVAAVYSGTQRDAADSSNTSCSTSGMSSNLAFIVPIVILGTGLLLCCGLLTWLFVPPRDIVLRLGPATVRIGRTRPGDKDGRSPTSSGSRRGSQRPGDSPTRRADSVRFEEAAAGILAADRAKEAAEPWAMGSPASLSPGQSRQSPAHTRVTHAEGRPLPEEWDGAAALGHGLTLAAPPSLESSARFNPLVPSPELRSSPRTAARDAPRPRLPPLTPLMMSAVAPDAGAAEALMMDVSPAHSSGSQTSASQQPAPDSPPSRLPTSPEQPLPHAAADRPSSAHLQSPVHHVVAPDALIAPPPDLRRRSLELGAFLPEAADHLLETDHDAGSLAGDGGDPLDMLSPLGAMAMPGPEDPLSPHAGPTPTA